VIGAPTEAVCQPCRPGQWAHANATYVFEHILHRPSQAKLTLTNQFHPNQPRDESINQSTKS
jgi:hypothetical protein